MTDPSEGCFHKLNWMIDIKVNTSKEFTLLSGRCAGKAFHLIMQFFNRVPEHRSTSALEDSFHEYWLGNS